MAGSGKINQTVNGAVIMQIISNIIIMILDYSRFIYCIVDIVVLVP